MDQKYNSVTFDIYRSYIGCHLIPNKYEKRLVNVIKRVDVFLYVASLVILD